MPQPHQLETPLASVRSAASAVQISSPCGTPARISRRKVPIPISLPPSPMEMTVAPASLAADRKRAESVIMSSSCSPRML